MRSGLEWQPMAQLQTATQVVESEQHPVQAAIALAGRMKVDTCCEARLPERLDVLGLAPVLP